MTPLRAIGMTALGFLLGVAFVFASIMTGDGPTRLAAYCTELTAELAKRR